MIPLNQKHRRSYLLMNKHSKCITSMEKSDKAAQVNCDPNAKQQLWMWLGDGLCNGLNQFISKVERGTKWDPVTQRVIPNFEVFLLPAFTALKSVDKRWNATSQGQLVSNGLCLGVDNNLDSNGAILSIDSCDEKEKFKDE